MQDIIRKAGWAWATREAQKVDQLLPAPGKSGEWGLISYGFQVSIEGDENVLKLDIADGYEIR